MKAIEFEGHNIKIAEHQPEYATLPAFVNKEEGSIVFCMELDDQEMEQVINHRRIFIKQVTFGQPMQPIGMSALEADNLGFDTKMPMNVLPANDAQVDMFFNVVRRIAKDLGYIEAVQAAQEIENIFRALRWKEKQSFNASRA